MSEAILLIATVGGSAEPIAVSLRHWRPARVLFVPSEDTRARVDDALALAATEGVQIPPGAYDVEAVRDAQDLNGCLRTLRRLDAEVHRWLGRGEGFVLAVDYTGGTKTMSAALALWARRWPCRFSYVGGAERTREGVGVVVSGQEHTLVSRNPWDALGYQAVEDASTAFDAGDFGAATALLQEARRATDDGRLKRELTALLEVVEAYRFWDRFRHRDAATRLEKLVALENDLRAVLGSLPAEQLLRLVDGHRAHLQQLLAAEAASQALVVDLLANARRRAAEGRFDDAVARLYRATEALAQIRLRDEFGLATGAVPLADVPEPLRGRWSVRARDGTLKLGLQDAFELLRTLGDAMGQHFAALGLAERASPLTARNQSILAHGWEPIGEKDQGALWEKVLALAGCTDAELPSFPCLSHG